MQINSEFLTLLFDPKTGNYSILSDYMILKDIKCYFLKISGQPLRIIPQDMTVETDELSARLVVNRPLRLVFEVTLSRDSTYLTCRLSLSNKTKGEIALKQAVILDCQLPEEMDGELVAFKQGFYSSDETLIQSIKRESTAAGSTFHSELFTAVRDRRRGYQLTAGFINQPNHPSGIEIENGRIRALVDFNCLRVPPGATVTSGDFYLDLGNEQSSLARYVSLAARKMKARVAENLSLAYSLNQADGRPLDESRLLEKLRQLEARRNELPVDLVMVESGYWPGAGSNVPHPAEQSSASDDFYRSLAWAAEQIHSAGFRAGLSVIPFLIPKSSDFFRENPQCLVRDMRENPKPIMQWGDETIYALDVSHPTAQDWFKTVFNTIFNEWGYDVVRIDHAYTGAVIGRRFDFRSTRFQIYRRSLELVRETCRSERTIMVGRAPVGPSIGLAEGIRFEQAPDLTAGVPTTSPAPGKANLRDFARTCLGRSFMNRRFWLDSPAVPLMNLDEPWKDKKETELRLTLAAMCNGLNLLAGDLDKLTDPQLKLIQALYPPYRETGVVLDLLESEYPSLIALPVETEFDRWVILGAFNWNDRKTDLVIPLRRLGLKSSQDHHVFDFWGRKYLGLAKGKLVVKDMKPNSARLLRICRVRKRPQLVSCLLHFTQGGVEVEYFRAKTDSIEARVKSQAARQAVLWIYNPGTGGTTRKTVPTNSDQVIKLDRRKGG